MNTSAPASGSAPSAVVSSSASAAPSAPAPPGYVEISVLKVIATEAGAAVLLVRDRDDEQTPVLPIFVNGTEAVSIDLRSRGDRFPRPLTHDLLDRALDSFGSRVLQAKITGIEGTTFIGALVVSRDGGILELDSRPSDAIAMALGAHAPIYIDRIVLERAGVPLKDLDNASGARKPRDPMYL